MDADLDAVNKIAQQFNDQFLLAKSATVRKTDVSVANAKETSSASNVLSKLAGELKAVIGQFKVVLKNVLFRVKQ